LGTIGVALPRWGSDHEAIEVTMGVRRKGMGGLAPLDFEIFSKKRLFS